MFSNIGKNYYIPIMGQWDLSSEITSSIQRISKKKLDEKKGYERKKEKRDAEEMAGMEMIDAERARDIVNGAIIPFTPSPEQIRFTELYVSGVVKKADAARHIGVAQKTIYNWFQDLRFRLWFDGIRRQVFSFYKMQIDRKLFEKAMKGSYKHMELFYTLSGDLTKKSVEETVEGEQIDSMDVSQRYLLLQRKISVIRGNLGDGGAGLRGPENANGDSPPETEKEETDGHQDQ